MAISFAVSAWSGWTPSLELLSLSDQSSELSVSISDVPDVSLVPPMLRRRLNLLGRACAAQALQHLSDSKTMPIVYCSRHGDIVRTLQVLEELAADEPVSPMHFSLAVHNAICGVLSIQLGMHDNITAISSGESGLVPTLLEAVGQLSPTCPEVLCLICDVTLPEVYQIDDKVEPHHAVSFVVSLTEGQALSLQKTQAPKELQLSSPLQVVEFLSSESRHMQVMHNGACWDIRKK